MIVYILDRYVPGLITGVQPGIANIAGIDRMRDVINTQDITPEPNALVVEVECTDDVFAEIVAHPDYGEGAILYVE